MGLGDILAPVGIGALFGGPFGAAAGLQYAGGQQTAQAQAQAAQAQLDFAKQSRAEAINAAQPTTAELTSLGKQIDYQSKAVDQQQQLLNSIDPALMEAGHQALALLRGQESTTLAPLRAERERQRAALANRLIASQGGGAELGTAGQEALNRFDAQTAQVQSQQQQATLGDLLRTSASVRPDPYQAVAAQGQISNTESNLQTRQINANLSSATPVYQSSGAPFVQQALQGQNLSAIGAGFNQTAATLAGAGIGKLA